MQGHRTGMLCICFRCENSVKKYDMDTEDTEDTYDVVILGSGIAGLSGALAAQEMGLRPVDVPPSPCDIEHSTPMQNPLKPPKQ